MTDVIYKTNSARCGTLDIITTSKDTAEIEIEMSPFSEVASFEIDRRQAKDLIYALIDHFDIPVVRVNKKKEFRDK